jgi:signal transduction histidine kinase
VAAIRAAAEQLPSVGDTEENRGRLAAVLMTSAIRLDGMVTQFLELARAESGLPNEVRESVDLLALLRGLIESLRSDERYRGLHVSLACPEGAGTIHGVSRRLESALRNLLDNAASFAGCAGTVAVQATQRDDAWEVSIQDTGPGIPEKDLGRLFERFFTTRGDRHGTGLGLALTRAVLEAHGGDIRAESAQGSSGARFVIRLPNGPHPDARDRDGTAMRSVV